MSAVVIDSFIGEHAYLSNFWEGSPIVYRDRVYATTEHFYQAFKAVGLASHEEIRNAPTPGASKKRGRVAKLVATWEADKFGVMWLALYLKFTQHPELAARLVATGDTVLVEGNTWHDQIWGNCTCGSSACSTEGANWLGRQLMALRASMQLGFPIAPID